MATIYHLTLHLLLVNQSQKDLMIGHHMQIDCELRSLIFYSAKIRCLVVILTPSSASGGHLFLSMVMNHHFQILHICTA